MAERPKLLVVAPIPPELRARLTENYDLVERKLSAGETLPGLAVAITTSVVGMNAATMAALPDLKLIGCNGAAVDMIDLAEAENRGITVCNTPDAVTYDTADTAISLIYATMRRVVEADRFVRSGAWKTERMTPSRRVRGSKVGIVGLGKIGGEVAKRTAALGLDVSYAGPRRKPDIPYRYFADVKEMAAAVDIFVLTCPASPETERLVDADVLSAIGSHGFLINISRGTVVDEGALIAALTAKTIAGAGLDVFEGEPRIDERFFTLDNVVLQPHYAAVTTETRHAIADTILSAVDDFYQAKAG